MMKNTGVVLLKIAVLLLFTAVALPVSIIDIKTFRIPNLLVAAGGFLAVLCCFIEAFSEGCFEKTLFIVALLSRTEGALLLFFEFLAVYFICRNKLGFGDVKYSLVCGAFSGFPGVLYAGGIAAAAGLLWFFFLWISGKKPVSQKPHSQKLACKKLPFAPFMSAGVLAVLAAGVFAADALLFA